MNCDYRKEFSFFPLSETYFIFYSPVVIDLKLNAYRLFDCISKTSIGYRTATLAINIVDTMFEGKILLLHIEFFILVNAIQVILVY